LNAAQEPNDWNAEAEIEGIFIGLPAQPLVVN
jgi:hypothetical protein